ncbi:MAG: hypothetical protein KAR51_04930, partial [Candidatus Aenigmarchaeota archaeon]|nr:hypothetical protein [Candidatus Aenigmarchaeota archaeon]
MLDAITRCIGESINAMSILKKVTSIISPIKTIVPPTASANGHTGTIVLPSFILFMGMASGWLDMSTI